MSVSPLKITDIGPLLWKGWSNQRIAKHLGVHYTTVCRAKRRFKLKGMTPVDPPVETRIDMDRFMQLHKMGYGITKLAREFGIGRSTVRRLRSRLGLEYAKKRQRMLTADDLADAKRLRAEGKTYAQIARYLGCAPDTVRVTINGSAK